MVEQSDTTQNSAPGITMSENSENSPTISPLLNVPLKKESSQLKRSMTNYL